MQPPHSKRIWQLCCWSDTWQNTSQPQRRLLGYILIIHFALALATTLNRSLVADEGPYFAYAALWAKGHPERTEPLMDSKTPLVGMAVIPALFKPWLPTNRVQQNDWYIKAGRPLMYGYFLLCSFVVFCWLTRLWGHRRWLVPFLFFCFDPLILSYSMVIGSDLPSAAIFITLIYAAWRYAETGRKKYWWALCLSAAFGVVLKSSLIYCIPLLGLVFTIRAVQKKGRHFAKAGVQVLQFCAVQLLFINLAYYGRHMGMPLGSIHFQSRFFGNLQSSLSFLSGVPVPLPEAFIQSFDWLKHNTEMGGCLPESTYKGVNLFGTTRCNQSLWYYYLAVALFKLPLLTWLALACTVVAFLKKGEVLNRLQKHLFLWLPPVYFLLIISFFNAFQIGIRHAMPVLPFLYIGVSGTFLYLFERRRWLFYGLAFLHSISLLRYRYNMMAYTNELVWNKAKVYQLVSDSSIDYNQTNELLTAFLRSHPNYQQPYNIPHPGKFAVAVGRLADQHPEILANDYGWLRNNFEPVGHYQFTILLYTITEADLKAKGLYTPVSAATNK